MKNAGRDEDNESAVMVHSRRDETENVGICRSRSMNEVAHKILVVDDNHDAADALGELLTMFGHTVRVAHDGPSALAIAQLFHPELVLLDISLPVMDGYELARHLREKLADRAPTLVAVTGYGRASDLRRSVDAGFLHHLIKPLDIEQLQRVIATSNPSRLTAVGGVVSNA